MNESNVVHIGGYFTPEKILSVATKNITSNDCYTVEVYINVVCSYLNGSTRNDRAIRVIKVLSGYMDYLL